MFFNVFCDVLSSKCEASPGYDTTGIQPVVKNSQIFELTSGFQYKIYEIRGCSKCENRLRHESCFSSK